MEELAAVAQNLADSLDTIAESEPKRRPTILVPEFVSVLADLRDGRLLLEQVDPYAFEHLIAELQMRLGYEDVEVTRKSGDGGVDIYAVYRDPTGRKLQFLTQCKRYREDRRIGPGEVQTLYGIVEMQRATGGMLVTSSYFTSGARKLEREHANRLSLHDKQAVYQWIRATGQDGAPFQRPS
jgi:restriction system protein